MIRKIKTKYRILPVYEEMKIVAWVIEVKTILYWSVLTIYELSDEGDGSRSVISVPAIFKTEDDAKTYINKLESEV